MLNPKPLTAAWGIQGLGFREASRLDQASFHLEDFFLAKTVFLGLSVSLASSAQ